ncbi:TPA: hypothetical protein ACU9T0_006013 [Burkholderia cenocepacia]|uniref:Uncharacterized protein n=1 Tax=Burkholderia vietnamiensis TaxID=60552 RepID=A0ABS1AXL5_BURVI|nr:hypothetical protein [Burkholderia vietnamiensis]MBJ9688827.1 hypothetical protein [Burkholderia vietnamiensis]
MTETPACRKARLKMLFWFAVTVGLGVTLGPMLRNQSPIGGLFLTIAMIAGVGLIAHAAPRTSPLLGLLLLPVWFVGGAIAAPFMFANAFGDWRLIRRQQSNGVWK